MIPAHAHSYYGCLLDKHIMSILYVDKYGFCPVVIKQDSHIVKTMTIFIRC